MIYYRFGGGTELNDGDKVLPGLEAGDGANLGLRILIVQDSL
jgi:hypothetical protein